MTINANLLKQIDLMRGLLRPEDSVEVISLLLLLKHYDPIAMLTIANMGKASQEETLNELITRAKSDFPEAVLASPNLINAMNSLHVAIDFVVNNSDDLALCQAIRTVINTLGRISEMGSSQNEQTLLSAIIGNNDIENLYDGTAGLANNASLIAAKAMTLRDINLTAYAIGYRMLTVEGKSFDYRVINSLVEPSIQPSSYDLVVMTPPFGLRLNNLFEITKAPYLLPDLSSNVPTSASDSLWIQLSIYAMSAQGKAYITLPSGVFFRGGYDAQLREYLVENELIEAIINLPSGMLDHTITPTVMLVLNKAKAKGSAIHFVDARSIMTKQGRKNILSIAQAQLIAEMARGLHPNHEQYKAVYLPQIREKKYVLNVAHYFDYEEEIIRPNIAQEKQKLDDATQKHEQSQLKLLSLLNKHMLVRLQ